MGIKLENWREEGSFKDVCEKYSDVSRFIILKTDVQRRGIEYSQEARKHIDPEIHQLVHVENPKNLREFIDTPSGLLLRDGTSIIVNETVNYGIRTPYLIDYEDGRFVIKDGGEFIEEVELWEKPDYYGKKTSSGTPMENVVQARPQRLSINPNLYCHFWAEGGMGCKFCMIGPNARFYRNDPETALVKIQDIEETIREAAKQRGRNTTVCACGGSILTGEELFDDEVQMYIDVFKAVKKALNAEQIKTQLISSSFSKKQLQRIKDETGNLSYTTDLELPTRELFDWICPGKAKYLGYDEWKRRIYDAVDVFGKGNVNSQIVAGADLVQPNGFKTEEESINAILERTEDLAAHGAGIITNVWMVTNTIIFRNFYPPSLEYYIRIIKGADEIRRKYGLEHYFDDYRRCGNHPNTDLSRI